MSRMAADPDSIMKAIAMREAGFTALAISQRIGISVRSLNRHFAAFGVRRGTIRTELIEAARDELVQHVAGDDRIRQMVASIIADDLAHAAHLRSIMIAASEHMRAESLSDAVLVMRAAAAYSTAIKNMSDLVRNLGRLQAVVGDGGGEMPELVVREITNAEVQQLAREIAVEAA